MKSYPSKPGLYRIEGGELPLTGKALLELMTAVLTKGCDFRFRARGWSMNPFIHDGDILCIHLLGRNIPVWGKWSLTFNPLVKSWSSTAWSGGEGMTG